MSTHASDKGGIKTDGTGANQTCVRATVGRAGREYKRTSATYASYDTKDGEDALV